MIEEFRPIVGYEGLYEVSNLGNVRSLNYNRKKGLVKELKFGYSKGYKKLSLSKDKIQKFYNVHRLVAMAFPEICGEWFDGCQVDHIDTNPSNNIATNLKVCTSYENNNNPLTKKHKSESRIGIEFSDSHKSNLSKAKAGKIGKYANRKKSVQQIDKITNEVLRIWDCITDVERELGINHRQICKVLKGRRISTGGFLWKYAT